MSNVYKYDPKCFYAIIPFFNRDYKGEEQYLEDVHPLTPEAWNNLLLSIIQNKGAISCFEDTIKYCESSIASDFIFENYSQLIEAIRSLQGSSIVKEQPFGKILSNSIPEIQG